IQTQQKLSYAALSYVWGAVPQSRLLSENVHALRASGSLMKLNLRIPQTIKDSIDFCAALEIQYLWVDSLCIVQDDSDTKESQIRAMHEIYRNAVLTIVDASSYDASGGLWGWNCPVWPYTTCK
ncbi:heterokaryon incompatibility protein-domain-containing protein, partial [Phaeosphaeriaceae sp. PMI808]